MLDCAVHMIWHIFNQLQMVFQPSSMRDNHIPEEHDFEENMWRVSMMCQYMNGHAGVHLQKHKHMYACSVHSSLSAHSLSVCLSARPEGTGFSGPRAPTLWRHGAPCMFKGVPACLILGRCIHADNFCLIHLERCIHACLILEKWFWKDVSMERLPKRISSITQKYNKFYPKYKFRQLNRDLEVPVGPVRHGPWGPMMCGRTTRYWPWAQILRCGTTSYGLRCPK